MIYRFDSCLLDTDRHVLMRAGDAVPVEPQVFDLLLLLLSHPDRLVTRDEMIEAVWQGRIVSESAVSARIASARKAVGDDGKAQRVIRTVARRGLQMAVPVEVEASDTGDAAPKPATPPQAPRIRYARTQRDRPIAWAVHGDGPPLVCANMIGTDLEQDWALHANRAMWEILGERHSVLRYDPAGTGQSGEDGPELDFDRQAEDLHAVVTAAGLDRFVLYADSGSVLTAVHFAARYPELVHKFVIVGGYAEGWNHRRTGASGTPAMMEMVRESWTNPQGAFASSFMLAYLPEGPLDAVHALADNMRVSIDRDTELAVRELQHGTSLLPLLPRITCPTLILHGRRDAVHPVSEARKLAAGIAGAELMTFDTANHLPVPGHPLWSDYVTAILDFLGRD